MTWWPLWWERFYYSNTSLVLKLRNGYSMHAKAKKLYGYPGNFNILFYHHFLPGRAAPSLKDASHGVDHLVRMHDPNYTPYVESIEWGLLHCSERMMNMPVQIAVPLYDAVLADVRKSANKVRQLYSMHIFMHNAYTYIMRITRMLYRCHTTVAAFIYLLYIQIYCLYSYWFTGCV